MSEKTIAVALEPTPPTSQQVPLASMGVLMALSLSHCLNDTVQSVLPAIYPLLQETHRLSFTQIGTITLTFQLTASMLQPLIGLYTDRRPMPYSLALGMTSTLIGLLMLSRADSLNSILISSALIGLGSSVFHPEASRLSRMASGGKHGFAQALFQVGGNFGTAIGPLLAAWIVVPHGQKAIAWFAIIAFTAIVVLQRLGVWYARELTLRRKKQQTETAALNLSMTKKQIFWAMVVLIILMISKNVYLVCLKDYYTFYLIDRFSVSIQTSQYCLFAFLFAVAAGTLAGGPIGDRMGRKPVIWASILGVAPFSLALPYANLPATIVLSICAGFILASAFSAIVVFAQELVPGRVGLVAGLFFGLAFGISGIASAWIGVMADQIGIQACFNYCAFLPLLGVFAVFLPSMKKLKSQAR